MSGVLSLTLALLAIYGCRKLLKFWNAIRTVENLPGYRVLFSQFSIPSLIARIPGVALGNNYFFEDKHSAYEEWDMNSVVSVFCDPSIMLTVADAETIKEITSSRARFPKPVYQYEEVSRFFGRNIVASEGEEWKKFRKIAAPAFSDRSNRLVWNETVQIVNSLFDDVWKNEDVISIDQFSNITISVGIWEKNFVGLIPAGHKMSFKESLNMVSTNTILKLLTPDWILKHGTARMQNAQTAFDELGSYMSEMIKERQSSDEDEHFDLLSGLLEANNEDSDEDRLTEGEIMGNIYIFLLAGHETAAHTMCFAFALLALHEEEQEKLFHHITSTLAEGQLPTYEDIPRLTYALAVFYETLRMFPPVVGIPKMSAEDTVLSVGNIHGQKRTVPIPKNTLLYINAPGLHYNPRYWDDPETFNPSRFLKPDWNRDAFIPFSAGVRACLGRRFSETEAIAVLTMMVLRYKISVKEEPQYANETMKQRRERVLRANNVLTITPVRVPLTFTRRK